MIMATQKFMGKGVLLERLTEQMRTQKSPPKDPEAAARAVLIARGMMDNQGNYTDKGKVRNNMTAEERAIDRAARRTGKSKSAFKYNPTTNMALRKK
jgi:hypothetical protein